ncbi:MAG: hypothetical protein JJW01_02205 [Alphaproteobacteria bacterium]|nr:hypothetical protein [Rickettsiales bacterium]
MNRLDVGAFIVAFVLFLLMVFFIIALSSLKGTVHNVRSEIKDLNLKITVMRQDIDISEVNKVLSTDSAKVKVLADKYLHMSFASSSQIIMIKDLNIN